MSARQGPIDTGDRVLHKPTGEEWVVAYVDGDRLCALVWPESFAHVSHCQLTRQMPDGYRQALLEELATIRNPADSRAIHARRRLELDGNPFTARPETRTVDASQAPESIHVAVAHG